MGCNYYDHWSFGQVCNPIGQDYNTCDETCIHNPNLDWETETVEYLTEGEEE